MWLADLDFISERELEDVNTKLESLERILQTLVANPKHNGPAPSSSSHAETLSTPQDSQAVWREVEFEGESSFHAHSKDITQAIESALSNSSSSNSIRDVSTAVATLRSFLNQNTAAVDVSTPFQRPLQEVVNYPELSNLPLPPMPAVLRLLRHAKSRFRLSQDSFDINLTVDSTAPEVLLRYATD